MQANVKIPLRALVRSLQQAENAAGDLSVVEAQHFYDPHIPDHAARILAGVASQARRLSAELDQLEKRIPYTKKG